MGSYLDHLIPRGTKHTLLLSQPTDWQNGLLSGPRGIKLYYYHNIPTDRMDVYPDLLIPRGTKHTLTQSQPTNWQNGPLSGPRGIKLYYYYHNIPTDRMEVHRDHVITRGTKHTLLLSQPTDWQNGPLSGPFDSKGNQIDTSIIITYQLTEWTLPGPFNTEGIKHTLPLTQPTYVNLHL